MWQYGKQIDHYTAKQMLAYAEAAQSTILEKVNEEKCEDLSLVRALQREKELQQQVVSLRNELRNYREREKTMGWNQN